MFVKGMVINMTSEEKKKRKRKNLLITLGVVLAIIAVIAAVIVWIWPKSKDISESTVFHAQEVEQQTQYIISLLDEADYTTFNTCTTGDMNTTLTPAAITQAKAKVSDNFGSFVSFGEITMDEMNQHGNVYAFAQQEVKYENVTVIYSLTFDENMKLVGLHIR